MLKFFSLTALAFSLGACAMDEVPAPIDPLCDSLSATYTGSVKAIIDGKCATAGCHSGAVFPDLRSYQGLAGATGNGSFNQRVLVSKDMPPGLPLTEQELQILQCWKGAGYPE